jgi:hypothetical protein
MQAMAIIGALGHWVGALLEARESDDQLQPRDHFAF